VDVELVEYDFAAPNVGLDTGETDVAIVRPPLDLDVSGLVSKTLVREPCVACVPARHRFASLESITIAQLVEEPIVAAPGDNVWRDYWILSSYRDKPARVAYEAATFEAELQAVSLGRGPSVVPASASRFYARPGVRFVPIADMPPCEVSVAFLETAPQAAANFAQLAVNVVSASA
jgi:DNA-binding transcriptional LysR family regulator